MYIIICKEFSFTICLVACRKNIIFPVWLGWVKRKRNRIYRLKWHSLFLTQSPKLHNTFPTAMNTKLIEGVLFKLEPDSNIVHDFAFQVKKATLQSLFSAEQRRDDELNLTRYTYHHLKFLDPLRDVCASPADQSMTVCIFRILPSFADALYELQMLLPFKKGIKLRCSSLLVTILQAQMNYNLLSDGLYCWPTALT